MVVQMVAQLLQLVPLIQVAAAVGLHSQVVQLLVLVDQA
jgi:hypothetical protein